MALKQRDPETFDKWYARQKGIHHESKLLMEEILHHLLCSKALCKNDKMIQNVQFYFSKISSINSIPVEPRITVPPISSPGFRSHESEDSRATSTTPSPRPGSPGGWRRCGRSYNLYKLRLKRMKTLKKIGTCIESWIVGIMYTQLERRDGNHSSILFLDLWLKACSNISKWFI